MVNTTGRAPSRTRTVFFAGAGLSCAFGLPNTSALLSELSLSAGKVVKGPSDVALKEAFKAFYPDGDKRHFLPDTVDFFSSLQAFIDIGAPGMPGIKLKSADVLLRQLKLGITRLLVDRIKTAEADGRLTAGHPYLDRMVSPGNVIVTTNWDLLLERYAALKGVDIRRTGDPGDSYVLLLKLHGSVDWCEWGMRKLRPGDPIEDFAQLREIKNRIALPTDGEREVVRVRAVEHWSRCWQRISGRTTEPFLVTMYRGKGPELASLTTIWSDAYHALGRAKSLEIVGYSLPDDDLEIRTLLRAGLTRGNQAVQVTVRNPAPDVHSRIRRHVKTSLNSDYSAV